MTLPTLGDVLDFTTATERVVIRDADDGSNAVELYDDFLGGLISDFDTPTGLRFTNFEHVKGSAFNDTLNLSKMSPGGEPTGAEQAQIDAAYQAFYAALGTGGYVDRETYAAAQTQLEQTLLTIRPYQQYLQIDGGGGIDYIKGAERGVSIISGGNETDFLYGGSGFSFIQGGAGTETAWFKLRP